MMFKWDTENLHITIWPDAPQIEIWTKRGASEVYKGKHALEFAAWLREHLPTDGERMSDAH